MAKKAFLSTDWHLGIYPLELEKWDKIQMDFIYKFFIPLLKERANPGDIFIFLGDLYHDRTNLPVLSLHNAEKAIEEISKILPVHIIVGNHDLWNRGDNTINSPGVFKWIPNVSVYSKTHTLDIDDKKLVLMPWVEKKKDLIDEINFNPGDYLFCHSDLNGCRMHLNSVAHRNKNKIDVSEFSLYKRVFSGHIHIRQVQNNFEFIGAPYHMDRNDKGDTKGVTILDIETGKTEFIENTVSPTFKDILVKTEEGLKQIEDIDTSNYFIDLTINNSLLVGKRKNRKYLEQVLENKKFSTVNYNNDIVKEKKQEDLIDVDIDADVDGIITTDMSAAILKYIDKIDYENNGIKKGVVDCAKEILKIHKEQYLSKKS